MNSFLLYEDRTISTEAAYPSFQDMFKDLNLNIVLKTMAQDDVFLMEQIRSVMMVPVHAPSVIQYRYDIIRDFCARRELLDAMYRIGRQGCGLAEQYKKEREQNRSRSSAGAGAVIAAFRFIEQSLSLLQELRDHIKSSMDAPDDVSGDEGKTVSQGINGFFRRLSNYPLEDLEAFHKQLLFYTTGGEGIFSIRISGGLKLTRSRLESCRSYKAASLSNTSRKLLRFYYKVIKKDSILVEDEPLQRDLHTFLDRHIAELMKIYEPFIDDLLAFWLEYGREISFYKGVNTLQTRMNELSLPFCYGECREDEGRKEIEDLYELSLALYVQVRPVPNSLNSKAVLTVITGANQGGKSTFLRSFGIAQVLMQCGMPVPAAAFRSGLYSRIHTHFTRKEDAMLSRGRLEEELKRMSGIISRISGDSLLLLNESFASTTEKEGSQIAYDIIMPLYENKIEVMMVTHLHEFAKRVYGEQLPDAEFLVAERKENGDRTFRMLRGKPHYSSYGTDLYHYMIGKIESN